MNMTKRKIPEKERGGNSIDGEIEVDIASSELHDVRIVNTEDFRSMLNSIG